jgi:hypothetical protein
LIACFASTESGRAGNDWGGGGCPSILFKALRMELNYSILQNCVIFANWNVGMLEYWNDGLRDYRRHVYSYESYWIDA